GQRRNPALGGDQVIEQLLARGGRSSAERRRPTDRRPAAGSHLRLPLATQELSVRRGFGRQELGVDRRKVSVEPCRPLRPEGSIFVGQVEVEVVEPARRWRRRVMLHAEYYNLVVALMV